MQIAILIILNSMMGCSSLDINEPSMDLTFQLVYLNGPEVSSMAFYASGDVRFKTGGPQEWAHLSDMEFAELKAMLSSSGFQYTFADDQIAGNQVPCCHGSMFGLSTRRTTPSIDSMSFEKAHWFNPEAYLPPDLIRVVTFVNTVYSRHFGEDGDWFPLPYSHQ